MDKITIDRDDFDRLVELRNDLQQKEHQLQQLEAKTVKAREEVRATQSAFSNALKEVDEDLVALLGFSSTPAKTTTTAPVSTGTGKRGNKPQAKGEYSDEVVEELKYRFRETDGDILTLKKADKQEIADAVGTDIGDVNTTLKQVCDGVNERGPKVRWKLKPEYQT